MTVIVVGAGIAGLTVARNLSRSKVHTVVLEAQDRVGGRVYTKNGHDFGASWIHDLQNNAFFPVAVELKLRLAYDQHFFFFSRGAPLSPYTVDRAFKLLGGVARAPLNQTLHEYAVAVTRGLPEEEARELQGVMRTVEHWTGMSWDEMSAQSAEMPHASPDAFNLSGNERFVSWIRDEIDWDYCDLRLEAPVARIAGGAGGGAGGGGAYTVTTEAGDTVTGSHVVCTIPVGALKTPGLFSLDLPAPLRHAIADSVMACLGKVFLRFADRWWDSVPDRMEVFGRSVDAVSPETVRPGDQPVFFTNVHKFTDEPVLVALTASPLTERVEAHPEEAFQLLGPALAQLRTDKTAAVPEPISVEVTNWSQNRFFNGSYSGLAAGQDEETVYGPFFTGHNGLRFAGEHATDDAVGTMHAAYVTGEREAARVLKMLGR